MNILKLLATILLVIKNGHVPNIDKWNLWNLEVNELIKGDYAFLDEYPSFKMVSLLETNQLTYASSCS